MKPGFKYMYIECFQRLDLKLAFLEMNFIKENFLKNINLINTTDQYIPEFVLFLLDVSDTTTDGT